MLSKIHDTDSCHFTCIGDLKLVLFYSLSFRLREEKVSGDIRRVRNPWTSAPDISLTNPRVYHCLLTARLLGD